MRILNNNQIGMATLMISVVMLTSIALMSVYTAQVGVMEQKISANHYRAKQAFEAAQAGLDHIIFNLDMRIVENALCTGGGSGVGVCDTRGLGSGTGNRADFVDGSGDSVLSNLSNGGAQAIGDYDIQFSQNATNPEMIDFTLSGYSGDNIGGGAPNQVVSQSIMRQPLLSYPPPAALISRGSQTLDTNVTVTNTSGNLPPAAWAGAAIAPGSAVINVTSVDDASIGGYYPSDATLAALTLGDVTADPVEPNKFFENFFSESFVNFQNRAEIIDCEANCTQAAFAGLVNGVGTPTDNAIIWVDAENAGAYSTLALNGAINLGTAASPVILIVDGNLNMTNVGVNIFGVVYTTQDLGFANTDGNVNGALVSEGNITITAANSVNVTYDNTVMTNIGANFARFTRVAGSWRDF